MSDIVGQDRAIGEIEHAMASGRMPHAFMFAGPQGVGRRTTATALAATLLCEKPVASRDHGPTTRKSHLAPGPSSLVASPLQACGQCVECRLMAGGSHPDFHLVYKELARYHDEQNVRERKMQELGIEVIRSFLIAPACRSPARGRAKVFVVREADLMSHAAQNALLKTLEEPPPGVTIILLVERPEEMLPTTLSRCRLVRFDLLPRQFVSGKLREKGVAAPEADFWAAYTGGSIGRAERLAASGMYEVKRDVIGRLAALGALGDAELGEYLAKLMEKLADAEIKAVKEAEGAELAKTLASRRAAGTMLELVASAYLDAMHVRAGAAGQESFSVIHSDQQEAIAAIARRFEPDKLARIIEHLSDYEEILWRNVNPKTVWDNVVISCATAAPLRL